LFRHRTALPLPICGASWRNPRPNARGLDVCRRWGGGGRSSGKPSPPPVGRPTHRGYPRGPSSERPLTAFVDKRSVRLRSAIRFYIGQHSAVGRLFRADVRALVARAIFWCGVRPCLAVEFTPKSSEWEDRLLVNDRRRLSADLQCTPETQNQPLATREPTGQNAIGRGMGSTRRGRCVTVRWRGNARRARGFRGQSKQNGKDCREPHCCDAVSNKEREWAREGVNDHRVDVVSQQE